MLGPKHSELYSVIQLPDYPKFKMRKMQSHEINT